ncbi:hypothetical protein NEHOM01_2213 [Nematocida homosporus]|uniref:uncharacterized protein n=1 Tax=Nematocida homosporus TaxID=1912981 RepID=UPI002220460B|nr:uncharacterized protein NEHOM01_2213 [Nematocida homosporus]KAI5187483.1 hypothetical protein NEHOM01_2213 [Nematocida homosporus]
MMRNAWKIRNLGLGIMLGLLVTICGCLICILFGRASWSKKGPQVAVEKELNRAGLCCNGEINTRECNAQETEVMKGDEDEGMKRDKDENGVMKRDKDKDGVMKGDKEKREVMKMYESMVGVRLRTVFAAASIAKHIENAEFIVQVYWPLIIQGPGCKASVAKSGLIDQIVCCLLDLLACFYESKMNSSDHDYDWFWCFAVESCPNLYRRLGHYFSEAKLKEMVAVIHDYDNKMSPNSGEADLRPLLEISKRFVLGIAKYSKVGGFSSKCQAIYGRVCAYNNSSLRGFGANELKQIRAYICFLDMLCYMSPTDATRAKTISKVLHNIETGIDSLLPCTSLQTEAQIVERFNVYIKNIVVLINSQLVLLHEIIEFADVVYFYARRVDILGGKSPWNIPASWSSVQWKTTLPYKSCNITGECQREVVKYYAQALDKYLNAQTIIETLPGS